MLIGTAIEKGFVKIMEKKGQFAMFVKPDCPNKNFIKYQFRLLDIYYPARLSVYSETN